MASISQRIILRIEVSPGIPQKLDAAVARFLSTHISVSSRLVDWLCEQEPDVQAAILGLLPEGHGIEVERRTIEGIAPED